MGNSNSTSLAVRECYLRKTPFFLLASKLEQSTLIVDLAQAAKVKKYAPGANLDKVQKGTFIIVCEGELVHAQQAVIKGGEDLIVARRKQGDFFRLVEPAFATKAQALAGSIVIKSVGKSVLLLLSPQAIHTVLKKVEAAHRESSNGNTEDERKFAEMLSTLMKQVRQRNRECPKSEANGGIGSTQLAALLSNTERPRLASCLSYLGPCSNLSRDQRLHLSIAC